MLSEQEAKDYVNKTYAESDTEGKSVQEKLNIINTIINDLANQGFAVVMDKGSYPVRVKGVSVYKDLPVYHV